MAGRHVAVSVTGPGGDAVLIIEVGVRPTRVRRVRLFLDQSADGNHAGDRNRD